MDKIQNFLSGCQGRCRAIELSACGGKEEEQSSRSDLEHQVFAKVEKYSRNIKNKNKSHGSDLKHQVSAKVLFEQESHDDVIVSVQFYST